MIKLLEKGFPGRDELMQQLDGILVKTIDAEGSLSLRTSSLVPFSDVLCTVPAEGYYSDEDQPSELKPKVHVLMHVKEGILSELEVYKDDGSPIIVRPSASRLIVE